MSKQWIQDSSFPPPTSVGTRLRHSIVPRLSLSLPLNFNCANIIIDYIFYDIMHEELKEGEPGMEPRLPVAFLN